MTRTKNVSASPKTKKDLFAKALGASKSIELTASGHGPFGALELAEEVERRIKPGKGKGRPTDASLVVRRLVGFRKSVWNILKSEAAGLSKSTRHSVSPSQLASILLEKQINQERVAESASTRSPRRVRATGKRTKISAIDGEV
jgi:hypothetical protein